MSRDTLSSSSSSEIMGTPFDPGAQRFEYPFPKAQESPTDSFLPRTPQQPPWPVHLSKSFPLTPPPLGKYKAHPKLRSANAREPPVPPGLVQRRSRILSSEEPGDDTAPPVIASSAAMAPSHPRPQVVSCIMGKVSL